MRHSSRCNILVGTLLAGCLGASVARADVIPYPLPGTENPVPSAFVATGTGDVKAYFYGTNASFEEVLGLLVNGVDTGIIGLDNQSTTPGTSIDFGSVNKGDKLTFYINVLGGGDSPEISSAKDSPKSVVHTYYSDTARNDDLTNHVYSSSFSGGKGVVTDEDGDLVKTGAPIPSGTYVGFEDLSPLYDKSSGGSDFNYTDEQFVFTNTSIVSNVPLPASAPMFGGALIALGAIGYGMKRKANAAA